MEKKDKKDNSEHQNLSPEEIKEFTQAWEELKSTLESKDAESAESQEKIAKLDKTLDEYSEKQSEMVKSMTEAAEEKDAIKAHVEELEAKLTRVGSGDPDAENAIAEAKAYEKFLRKGDRDLDEAEMKFLRTDSQVEGGYLAPPEYIQEIIKKITEISPMRSVARMSTTSRSYIEVPKRETLMQASFRGEGGQIDESNSTYGILKIPVHALDAITVATTHMLSDAAFDIAAEMESDWLESSAQVEGDAYLNGDQVEEPEGFLTNTDVQEVNSTVSGDFDTDDFFSLQGELKTGYSGTFLLNRRTLAKTRQKKGSDGQYLFAVATESMPATIGGDPFVVMNDMPDVAVASTPIAYGDWRQGYWIVDKTDVGVLRDPFTFGGQGKVRFIFTRWTGGKVRLAEAIKKLKIIA